MAAPKGNQYWKLAKKALGKPRAYPTPESLWEKALEYFQWAEENPLYEVKLVVWQGVATQEEIPKVRAFTLSGLRLFLGIGAETYQGYRNRQEYAVVISMIEETIRTQKFEHAAADLLNPNIIARDLGLKDGIDHSSNDGSMTPKPAIDVTKLSTAALAEIAALSDEAGPSDD
jgi:hypothetical protein